MATPMKAKPDLAILIGHALAKKGKAQHDPMAGAPDEESTETSEEALPPEIDQHLQEIADEMLQAIEQKDSQALKELLAEAFECLESAPHKEGPHLDGNSDSEY